MRKERDAPAAATRRHVVLTPIELGDPRRNGRVDAALGRVIDRGSELGEDAALTVAEGSEGVAGVHSTQNIFVVIAKNSTGRCVSITSSKSQLCLRPVGSRGQGPQGGKEGLPLGAHFTICFTLFHTLYYYNTLPDRSTPYHRSKMRSASILSRCVEEKIRSETAQHKSEVSLQCRLVSSSAHGGRLLSSAAGSTVSSKFGARAAGKSRPGRGGTSEPGQRAREQRLLSFTSLHALLSAGALVLGMTAGSVAHLAVEARDDLALSAPSTRARQLLGGVEAGVLSLVALPDGRRVYVRDAQPASGDKNAPTVLVVGAGLASSAGVVDALCARGLRAIACEEDLTVPAASAASSSSIPARADLLAAVLNARGIDGRLVIVAGSLDWLPALHFAERNKASVRGLLVIDPIVPHDFGTTASQPEHAFAAEPALSPLAAASAAISQAATVPSFALTLASFDPLHALEHTLVGRHHHHLFCGSDHGLVTQGPARQAAPAASRAATAASESDDTVDCTALHTEAVYRSMLYGLDHAPSLSEMLPSVGQSIAPTLARAGLHLGPLVASPPDARVTALDARVAANAHACTNAAEREAWVAGVQALSEELPVRIRITQPSDAEVSEACGRDEHAATQPTAAEVELRLRLQVDAGRRLGLWRSVLPQRVSPVACAARGSGHDVFEPDAVAIAAAAEALAGDA